MNKTAAFTILNALIITTIATMTSGAIVYQFTLGLGFVAISLCAKALKEMGIE